MVNNNIGNNNSQGYLVHNCRCDVLPEVQNIPSSVRRIKGEGEKKYVDYNTYAKERGIKQYGIRTVRVKR